MKTMEEQTKQIKISADKARPKKAALVISNETLRYYRHYLEYLTAALDEKSIHAAVITPTLPDNDLSIPDTVEIVKYPFYDIPLTKRQNFNILMDKLSNFKPLLIHCLCKKQFFLSRKLSNQLEVPLILNINSVENSFSLLPMTMRLAPKHLTAIVTPTKTIYDNLARIQPKFEKLTELVGIATHPAEQTSSFSDISHSANIVTVVGNISDEELENFISAVKNLMIEGYELMLTLIIKNSRENRLRKYIRQLGINKHVVITNADNNRMLVLSAADIFVQLNTLPFYDTLLLEAMSMGKTIAACHQGVEDLIVKDHTAVLFDIEDELSIRQTLQRLLDGPDTSRRLAANALEHLRKNNAIDQMKTAMLNLYEKTFRT